MHENTHCIQYDYAIGDQVFVTTNDVQRKLNTKDGPFEVLQIFTNGTVLIRCSATVTERIIIQRLHPAK